MSQSRLFADVERGATFSPCGRYRYRLWRTWDPALLAVNFLMLNPSTADAEHDDPTIKRCLAFAQAWGYGGIVVTNLYALRSTDPRGLWKAADPVGPENDGHVIATAEAAGLIVCAWGNHGSPGWGKEPSHRGRGPVVAKLLRELGVRLHALGVTSLCQPAHPLRLPGHLVPVPWGPEDTEARTDA